MKTRSLLAVACVALTSLAGSTQAVIIDDNESFSVGLGYAGNFNTTETDPANTPTGVIAGTPFVIGDFTVTISATSALFGSAGPFFVNRVLTNGDGGSQTAGSPYTTLTVTATYTGPSLPGDATNPNFLLKIDQFSVYVNKHPAYITADPNDDDTTFYAHEVEHNLFSQNITPPITADLNTASGYDHLVWNPADFAINNVTTATRTFNFRPGDYNSDPAGVFVIDGLELIGSAHEIYSIPEPASVALLGLGCLAIGRRRKA
jgi:hypothetical protein